MLRSGCFWMLPLARCCYALSVCDVPSAEGLLRDILEQNPDRKARGLACDWFAESLRHVGGIPDAAGNPGLTRSIEARFGHDDLEAIRRRQHEMRREARALFDRAAREFADLLIGTRSRRRLEQGPGPDADPPR